jgi:diguanylate cyclase
MALAETEIERSLRYEKKCSLMMIDIDNYKMTNDTFGHHAGDQVLLEFGKLCKGKIRRMDIAGRLGGDEFAIILPETDGSEARNSAERLRKDIERKEMHIENTLIKVTASFGVAQLKGKIKDLQGLMDAADKAMYAAKQAGKNQTHLFGEK